MQFISFIENLCDYRSLKFWMGMRQMGEDTVVPFQQKQTLFWPMPQCLAMCRGGTLNMELGL